MNPASKVINQLMHQDRAVHDWYRFILSFPPQLVRHYLLKFGATDNKVVLDPFSGTGTTLVECKKQGIPCIGIEANPVACFASQTKVNWLSSADKLKDNANTIADAARQELALMPVDGLSPSLSDTTQKLLFKNAISPMPLKKVLTLLGHIDQTSQVEFYNHQRLALAKAAVLASNLRFAPEVGISKKLKTDAPVIDLWLDEIATMGLDMSTLNMNSSSYPKVTVILGDARTPEEYLPPNSVDLVITSPPYPNEKDYTRATRLEAVVLGFLQTKADLRAVKQNLIRSNSRSIYVQDTDDAWINSNPEVLKLAQEIDERRKAWGKTSGFSRLYARATKLYFGGMTKHLATLRSVLRPGAQLAYVVGDQASYLRVHIQTGKILQQIAQDLGYEVMGLDLFRTRRASKTEVDLREEVVLLKWPGSQ